MTKYTAVFNTFCICLSLLCICTSCQPKAHTLTILHTNDTHSQVEPIAPGKRDGNHAGYARRMGLIARERALDPHLLLFDAGDFTQGTPYFNFYHGRVEVEALGRMGYDAVTLGNHEFDYGVDTLAAILRNAPFAVVNANYDATNTPLEGIIQPYIILNRAGVRVGVLGVGVNPEGLISERNFAPLRYTDPIQSAQQVATLLREKHHCDLVICLSHLGTDNTFPSDAQLAQSTRDIDIIIGGHTHKLVCDRYEKNLDGKNVLLTQMGKSGARIGKISLKMSE